LGINKQQASRWQRAAALPVDIFEHYLAETKGRHEPLTSAAVLALANSLRQDPKAEPPIDMRPMFSDTTDLFRLIDAGTSFSTIYVDPPYATLSLHELAALPVKLLAAEQAHLHLWTSNATLFDAKAILEAWGFLYRSTFVWVNPFPGRGPYWRQSHAVLVLGVRGACAFREEMRSWVEAPAEPGGGKPHIIREMIERVSPAPYLELFSGQPAPNWTVWHPQLGCIVDEEQGRTPLQTPATIDRLGAESASTGVAAKSAAQSRPSPESDLAAAWTSPGSGDFRLPPETSFTQELLPATRRTP
jgi:N6-adenosine-specific RNA methylase IME4